MAYLTGTDVPVSRERALKWLELAAAQGFGRARAALERLRDS